MSRNTYHKYLTPEDHLQINCNRILAYYPKLLWAHIPNEGKRSRFEQWKFKQMGAKSGVPDLIIFTGFDVVGKHYNGCAIELKAAFDGKGNKAYNKPTANQKVWLANLDKNGWYTEVIKDAEVFHQLIKKLYNI